MIKAKVISLIALVIVLASFDYVYDRSVADQPLTFIKGTYISGLESTLQHTQSLTQIAQDYRNGKATLSNLETAIDETRAAFKTVEFLLQEMDYELVVQNINGAPLPKLEKHVPEISVIDPNGLQTLDELIYLDAEANKDEIIHLAAELEKVLTKTITYQQSKHLQHRFIAEAIRYGVVSVFTLGVTGFDTPGSANGLEESIIALDAMHKTLSTYEGSTLDPDGGLLQANLNLLAGARDYIRSNNDFDTFDRLTFLKDYIKPLYKTIYLWQRAANIELVDESDPTMSAHNYYDTLFFDNSFLNAAWYTGVAESDLDDPSQVELGRKLFYDPALSRDLTISCASCHNPAKGFADGRTTSLTNDPNKSTFRHSPSLINSAYYGAYFWDMREHSLERQIKHVMFDTLEFNMDFIDLAERLKSSTEYYDLFKAAYGDRDKYGISTWSISNALATYVASLSSWDSPFDQYVRGETDEIDQDVKAGFNLFMGKAACGTCHFAPAFNGTVPPYYQDSESENLGITMGLDTLHPQLDNDPGRIANGKVNESADHYLRSMKTVTVRNAGITAPYMHNGAFETLEEVMHFYNHGGAAGLGIDVPYQTLPDTHLGLDSKEINQLVAFVEALTDTVGMTSTPTSLPSFDGRPEWNDRLSY